jgi:tetratricopeptide (TPR) repeat protein
MTGRLTSFRICAIALAVAGMAAAVYPQTGMPPKPTAPTENPALGTIQGRVTLPSGDPVNSRVRITLSTPNDPGMAIYTDNNGNFTFANLRQGGYSIEVIGEAKLYDPVTEQVFLPRGARITVTIALRDKGEPAEKKRAGHVVSAAEMEEKIPDAARKEYEQATGLVTEGKIAEAVKSFNKALTIFPRYLKAHNDLGAQYLKLKQLDEAVEQFEAALDINPKAFNPRLNLGIARVKQKKYSEALEHLNQAISMDSSSAAAHLYLGMVLEETDELPAAERELRTAISLGEQQYAVAHFYLAQLQMKKGDKEQTINELTIFLKESPHNEFAGRARQILEELKQQ